VAIRRFLLAVSVIILTPASSTLAVPKHIVQRGTSLIIETRFGNDVKIQAASMTWQTYSEVSRRQKKMATAFRCDADVVAGDNNFALSCKVPLDVADGDYYLTSISIRADGSERKYNWSDEPIDVMVQVKGGEEVPLPQLRSILVK
jgi:hypothetical protein